jgi:alkanesulfonate monooxygenase SsuD/methylene tetrahydromethanopterin reductase-like flavin-dependent oxidoreductase (luciferase family)
MVNVSDLGFGVAGALDHDVVRVVARRLEQEGFRTLWINDTPDGDSLAGLAAAAGETSTIRLATGVISIDRRSPDVIARAVRGHRLPEHRLVIGIGAAAKPRPLERVGNALDAIRAELSCRTMVGALGPKMRRLAAQHSDGVLLNWLTPEAARDAVADMRRDAEYAGTDVESCLYVRSALGPVASERMVQEAERYQRIPSYAANFKRMGVKAGETTVAADSPPQVREGLDRYAGILDELVVRAVTPTDAAEEYLGLIDAILG